MQRMPSLARAELLVLDLLDAAGDLDFGTVVQIAALGALHPDHFTTFFGHDSNLYNCDLAPGMPGAKYRKRGRLTVDHARIFVTTPDPTVLPPSRTAKRSFSSMAIGD